MSDFGSGYALCLLMFTYHGPRLDATIKQYAKMREEIERVDERRLFTEEHAVSIWANGAKDHLMDLKKPPKVRTAHWAEALSLATTVRSLDWSLDDADPDPVLVARKCIVDAHRLLHEAAHRAGVPDGYIVTLENAEAVDMALGLKLIDRGTWGCSDYLKEW